MQPRSAGGIRRGTHHALVEERARAQVEPLEVAVHLGPHRALAHPVIKHRIHLRRDTHERTRARCCACRPAPDVRAPSIITNGQRCTHSKLESLSKRSLEVLLQEEYLQHRNVACRRRSVYSDVAVEEKVRGRERSMRPWGNE
jgi:hypothetical protein